MDSPAVWAFIWLAVAATFGVGEILVAGTFFLLPFAAGALAAAFASFLSAPLVVSWLLFILVSIAAFLAMKPLARKLDLALPAHAGFGANRLIGTMGVVSDDIPLGVGTGGMVQIGGEMWRAEGRDGMGMPTGTQIRIIEVRGTRVVVEPASQDGLTGLA